MSNTTRENPMFSDDDIIEMARSVEPHDFDRIAPPPQVWNNVLAELEVEVASQEASARRQTRHWFSSARLLSAAAVTLLMVGVAVAVVTFRGDDTQVSNENEVVQEAPATAVPPTTVPPTAVPPTTVPPTAVPPTAVPEPVVTQVAAAALTDEGLPVATTETAAALFVCEDDDCYVELNLTALPDAGTDALELWVINGDVTDMHSLGNLDSSDGRYRLPAGVTADGFPIVDISIEPDDGDATHSGQSVLRGVFESA